MAARAQEDQRQRKVEVNRRQLVTTLKENREKHVGEYRLAIEGYKAMAASRLDEEYEKARRRLEKNVVRAKGMIDDTDPRDANDYICLVEGINVHLKVPRCYSKEYDAAIDMAEWDVRETLELKHAEFQCFVRDEWDWKDDFSVTSKLYNN